VPLIVVLGVNHRTAPLSVRERLAFDDAAARRALERLRADARLGESLILSTCNRTELYAVAGSLELAARCLREVVCESAHVDALAGGHHYALEEREAERHLLRVAAGLESQIVGEPQILGQVKQARALARQAGSLGPLLDRLFDTALHAGKRARAETAIGEGTASVAAAALEIVARRAGGIAGKSFLVVGAGQAGRLAARHIAEHRVARLLIANRSPERARLLAQELHAEAVAWEALGPALSGADVVVCATRAPGFVVERSALAAARAAAPQRPCLFVDLAVPRDVDPEVTALPGVELLSLDGVHEQVRADVEHRLGQAPRVELIVEQELAGFAAWRGSLGATPVLRELRDHFERVRAEELRRSLRHVAPEAQQGVERITQALVNKLLHAPSASLRAVDAGSASGLQRLNAVRELFGLAPQPARQVEDHEHDA
jgi:glutamyl-tRNA reductase